MRKDDELKGISVIGLGKLGAPLAACFASKGYPTIGVDSNPDTVGAINQKRAPLYEPGLRELIQTSAGRLRATDRYEEAILHADATFIIVPTPSEAHGGFSLRYVLEAGERIGESLRKKAGYHLVVLTSTVMPGSTENELKPLLEKRSGKKCGPDFGLCYSPQFIALGSVIRDFLNPDFVLIGESDPVAGESLSRLYKNLYDNNPRLVRMNFVNAELTKISVNTFVTTKISFANMLARICERLPGADVDVVTSALGLDSRIGQKYLKGAVGYGGPCFPRDNLALSACARSVGTEATLAKATDSFNRQEIKRLTELVKAKLPKKGRVAILGLAYKPHTDVVEESQGFLLAKALAEAGVSVVAYDPVAMAGAKRRLSRTKVTFADSLANCIRQADIIVIATAWNEFRQVEQSLNSLDKGDAPRIVIDCWRLLDASRFGHQVAYVPLGIGFPSLSDRVKK